MRTDNKTLQVYRLLNMLVDEIVMHWLEIQDNSTCTVKHYHLRDLIFQKSSSRISS